MQLEDKEYSFKVILVGQGGVGKSSFVRRCVHNTFSMNYQATILVDFATKKLDWDEHTKIDLVMWDIAGQQRRSEITRSYYRGAVGAFVVFDVTEPNTLEDAIEWKAEVDRHTQLSDGSRIPAVLLANKCDIAPSESIVDNPDELNRLCAEHGFCAWFACSVRDNIRIEESMRCLVEHILKTHPATVEQDPGEDVINLNDSADQKRSQENRRCAC